MASAVSAQGSLFYHYRFSPYDTDAIIEFLEILLSRNTSKIMIVWDGASVHKSKKLRAYLADNDEAKRLHLVIQPSYSPQLNVDEQVWHWLKNVALKNVCLNNFKELQSRVITEIQKLAENHKLVQKFFHHPAVAFY